MDSIDSETTHANGSHKYLGLSTRELAVRGSLATAREITQQPQMWREAHEMIDVARDEINAWLDERLNLAGVRVLFCGAGTSAFIGDSIASSLRATFESEFPISFVSVSTTDLVADPKQYLGIDQPTIMVSFARSGDSPESVACVEFANAALSQCYHLIFTCNLDGNLAVFARTQPQALCFLMPDGTNDEGFAMTSSYSSMLVACAALFRPDKGQLNRVAAYAGRVISELVPDIFLEATKPFDRLVVLGAGVLKGTAHEAALKCLELAGGKLVSVSDTPLGFRHGPKIVISPDTAVILLRSNDPYTAKYDQDLLDELRQDAQAACIIEVSLERLFGESDAALDDIWLSLVYIVYCQILAFLKSYALGITVDSPCPSGEVNRVVEGVAIYEYAAPKSK